MNADNADFLLIRVHPRLSASTFLEECDGLQGFAD